ncbi:MAG: hypothetical protein EHJ94_09185, partial [Deltaproteobacteria bacterium]
MVISYKINLLFKNPVVPAILSFILLIAVSVLFLSREMLFGPDVLDRIMDKGEIVVITRNNAHCYYIDRDQAMGFEHDLVKEFS